MQSRCYFKLKVAMLKCHAKIQIYSNSYLRMAGEHGPKPHIILVAILNGTRGIKKLNYSCVIVEQSDLIA